MKDAKNFIELPTLFILSLSNSIAKFFAPETQMHLSIYVTNLATIFAAVYSLIRICDWIHNKLKKRNNGNFTTEDTE